jgi:hypothetical protein
VAVQPGHLLQHFAALELAENAAERPPQVPGVNLIADSS